jgi:hypothetical protein
MSKGLRAQTAKRPNTADALITAPAKSVGPENLPSLQIKGKSVDPNFMKLTSYIRRETHRAVKRRLLDEDKEISELVEELLTGWLSNNCEKAVEK